jgi:predicted flavoprotein YhiN
VLLEEDAAPVTDLLFVRMISEGLEIVVGSRVGEEEEQAQEFAVDATCMPIRMPMSVLSIGVAIITNLGGSGALEELIRVFGVAQLAMVVVAQPWLCRLSLKYLIQSCARGWGEEDSGGHVL